MPGGVPVSEALAQSQAPGLADFTMIFVGPSAKNPVASGKLTPSYSDPSSAASDLGASDLCDALMQAIAQTNGNPQPPPAYAYVTPATTAGVYATINVAGVLGTCIPANGPALPLGTYEPWMQVVVGGVVGVTGMTALASLDAGRTRKLVQLGTKTYYNFPAADGWPCGGGQAEFTLGPPSGSPAALYTALNNGQTALIAHFIDVAGSPAVHAGADNADNVALTAVAAASTPATAVTLFNALLSLLKVHVASAVFHTVADAVATAALAAIPAAVTIEDCELHTVALRAAYEAHRVLVGGGPVHGAADAANTWAAYSPPSSPTLLAGDTWFDGAPSTAPIWADADLYAAGPPATGAFAAIAESGIQAAVIVLTEPVTSSDFATIVAGLNYCKTFGKRFTLLCRFRDPLPAGETDAAYITAFQTFAPQFLDSRIACCAGSCWLTDSFSASVYLRSFIAAVCARWQSCAVIAGQEGERLAQNLGWVARGALEGASVKDGNGNQIGHDESVRGGITAAPGSPTGGGIALYYQRNAQKVGTYVDNEATLLYPIGSTILLPQDRRVVNALEQIAVSRLLDAIGGADIISDPASPPVLLDADIVNALAGGVSQDIRDIYPREIQNADDPNVVTANPTVTVVGGQVAITATLAPRLYGYTDTIALTVSATR